MAPRLFFGTGVIGMDGMELQDESITKLLLKLKEVGISHLDTAARYPPFNPGKSEQLLGAAQAISDGFVINTKVYTEMDSSLERLRRPEGVDVLFAHRPDPATPLEEQVQGFQEQLAQGHAKTWGLANHPPKTLQKVLDLCDKNSWEKPAWYQGAYNMFTRGMETRLLPILRAHNISFLASHVLGSGFLMGKHINAEGNPVGRFVESSYANPEVAAAMKTFVAGCEAHDMSPMEMAIR